HDRQAGGAPPALVRRAHLSDPRPRARPPQSSARRRRSRLTRGSWFLVDALASLRCSLHDGRDMAVDPAADRPAGERSPCPGAGHPAFHLRAGELWCEDRPVAALAAEFGTPLYVYSGAAIDARIAAMRAAFGADAHVCYAVKANSNLSLLRRMHERGVGFDVVSGGELQRLVAAGVPTSGTVFAGV